MKFFKILSSLFACFVIMFAFTGCSWFGSPDTGGSGGSGGGGGLKPGGNSFGDTTYPDLDDDALLAQMRADATQGVRSTYLPSVDEVSSDEVLQKDRQKYFENSALQYEIVAEYVLHVLQGKYGNGMGEKTITYEFYADKSLLPQNDEYETKITLPQNTPQEKGGKLLETHKNAINNPVVDIEYPLSGGHYSQPLQQVYDESLKWNMSGGDIVASFKRIVQMNLMEYSLGKSLSPISTNLVQAQTKVQEYAKEIDKLGIPQTNEFKEFLISYIKNTIIGSNLIARETQTITYNDIYYEKYEQVGTTTDPETGEETPVYDWVQYWYNISGSGAGASLTSDTAYKFGYVDTINQIINAVLGENGFTKNFPTYTRVEITDTNPVNFFNSINKEAQIQKISSMDYYEYNSLIVYPDAIMSIDENGEDTLDYLRKWWQFDFLEISVDSKNDITLDVYLRIHLNSENTFIHITRINTDSTKGYDYEGQIEDSEKYLTQNGDLMPEYYFDGTKTNRRSVLIYDYVDKNTTKLLTDAVVNPYSKDTTQPNFRAFYNGENAYKNTFVGKLGSSVSFEQPTKLEQQGFNMTNFYEENVDFSQKYLCQDSGDFVEFIFDVKKDNSKPANYDYSFKYCITTSFWGETIQDLE